MRPESPRMTEASEKGVTAFPRPVPAPPAAARRRAFPHGIHSAALIVNDDPSRNFRQLTKAEFDDDSFVFGQLHPFDQADQQFAAAAG